MSLKKPRNLAKGSQRNRLAKLVGQIESHAATGAVDPEKVPDDLPDKDKPVLMAALAMNASHLLTGDVTHFGSYYGRQIEGIAILLPGDYLKGK